jgi:hypothetical protein
LNIVMVAICRPLPIFELPSCRSLRPESQSWALPFPISMVSSRIASPI